MHRKQLSNFKLHDMFILPTAEDGYQQLATHQNRREAQSTKALDS